MLRKCTGVTPHSYEAPADAKFCQVCAAAFEPIDQATELAAMSAKIEAEMHNALAEKVTKLETTVTELLTQLEDIAKALETEEHADDAKAGKVLNTWLKKQAAYWTGKVGSK